MKVPKVGNVVWYHTTTGDDLIPNWPFAAIVCFVHNNRQVNLAVFDENGNHYARTNVFLKQLEDTVGPPHPGQPYCEWVP